jgi:hypothetical protein
LTEGADKCLCAFKAERKIRADEAEARRHAHALALRVEVQVLVDKAARIKQYPMYHSIGSASHKQMCLDVTFQLAEVAVPRELFRKILSLIDDLRPRPAPA